jgi:hypothetical protein
MGRFRTRTLWFPLAALILAVCLGCESDPIRGGEDELPQAVLATFRTEGEVFKVRVTRKSTIVDLYVLQGGGGTKTIIRGPLGAGPGEGEHNTPWSWHMRGGETILTDQTDESCDANPSQVETDLAEWLTKEVFCPTAAELIALQIALAS